MQYRVVQPWPKSKRARQALAQVGSIKMPRKFSLQVTDDEGSGEPDVELFFEVREGVPECRAVHITATDAGHEVRVSGLAGIRVEDLLERAVQSLAMYKALADGSTGYLPLNLAMGTDEHRAVPVSTIRTARAARKVTITDELLREVADVYRGHIGDKPTVAVARRFDKEPRTARVYIKRARERGFLGAALKGKAGEQ